MPEDLFREQGLESPAGAKGERTVSRRQFLKLAGVAGATLGAGSGIAAFVASCGGEETTTTSAGGSSSTSSTASSTTTSGESSTTTSVSAGVEKGAEIKIGYVSPVTGPLASFGVAESYSIQRWKEAIGDGIVGGDGKLHPVTISIEDTQSDSNRAAQVAGDLIQNTKVQLMMAASGPDTVTPVAGQCEAMETPLLANDCPLQTFVGAAGDYKWCYLVAFGGEDAIPITIDVLDKVPTNKKCGLVFDNSADGNAFLPFYDGFLKGGGYETVNGGQFQPGAEDFTTQIAAFKKAGCECLAGNCNPSDFTNFWKQVFQQGLKAKACTIGKALLFPQSVDSLGDVANNLTVATQWHPSWPFKSSLTGETCAELASDFEAKVGQQWTQPLAHYVCGEMAVYTIKNATDPTNKESLLTEIENMKLDTIQGPIDFTEPLLAPSMDKLPAGPGRKTKNVYGRGLCMGQWQMLGGKWKFDLVPVSKAAAPFMPDNTVQVPKPLSL